MKSKTVRIASTLLLILTIILVNTGCENRFWGTRKEAAQVAARLGCEPTWQGIRTYLSDYAFQQGMTIGEARQILDLVGPHTTTLDATVARGVWNPKVDTLVYREFIEFVEPSARVELYEWYFGYIRQDDEFVLYEWEQLKALP